MSGGARGVRGMGVDRGCQGVQGGSGVWGWSGVQGGVLRGDSKRCLPRTPYVPRPLCLHRPSSKGGAEPDPDPPTPEPGTAAHPHQAPALPEPPPVGGGSWATPQPRNGAQSPCWGCLLLDLPPPPAPPPQTWFTPEPWRAGAPRRRSAIYRSGLSSVPLSETAFSGCKRAAVRGPQRALRSLLSRGV